MKNLILHLEQLQPQERNARGGTGYGLKLSDIIAMQYYKQNQTKPLQKCWGFLFLVARADG